MINVLEVYINIAKTLKERGPQTLEQVASFLKSNPSSLKQKLNFLVSQKMIVTKRTNIKSTYDVTATGIKVLEFFKA